MDSQRLLLSNLTRDELNRIAADGVVVFPTGATEQHGPHLPVGTDAIVVEQVTRGAVVAVADRLPVVMAPTLPFGSSPHHLPFGGTMSVTSETYYAVVRDLVASLIAGGFRRILIVNGHGGNHELLQVVVRDLALRHPVNLAALSYWLPAANTLAALHADGPTSFPGHAGAFETSLVMAIRPELVRRPLPHRELAEIAALPVQPSGWRLERHAWWQAIDGFSDSPDLADVERGRASLEAIVQALARVIGELHATALTERGTVAQEGLARE